MASTDVPASLRWNLFDLAFSLSLRPTQTRRNLKFVIARRTRPELPHFTISWGNPSGEVDLHWKFERANLNGGPLYVPIARTHGGDLANSMEPLNGVAAREIGSLLTAIRPASPAWLRRHRYNLVWAAQERFKEHFLSAIPKRQGKYHPNLPALIDETRLRTVMDDALYYPSLLKVLTPSREHGLISAFSDDSSLPELLISPHPRRLGTFGWSLAPWRDYIRFHGRMTLAFIEHLLPKLTTRHRDTFEHVVDILAVHEVVELTDIVGGLRLLMDDPAGALARIRWAIQKREDEIAMGSVFRRSQP